MVTSGQLKAFAERQGAKWHCLLPECKRWPISRLPGMDTFIIAFRKIWHLTLLTITRHSCHPGSRTFFRERICWKLACETTDWANGGLAGFNPVAFYAVLSISQWLENKVQIKYIIFLFPWMWNPETVTEIKMCMYPYDKRKTVKLIYRYSRMIIGEVFSLQNHCPTLQNSGMLVPLSQDIMNFLKQGIHNLRSCLSAWRAS